MYRNGGRYRLETVKFTSVVHMNAFIHAQSKSNEKGWIYTVSQGNLKFPCLVLPVMSDPPIHKVGLLVFFALNIL